MTAVFDSDSPLSTAARYLPSGLYATLVKADKAVGRKYKAARE